MMAGKGKKQAEKNAGDDSLTQVLRTCETERDAYLEGWKRAKADALNEKKRQQQLLSTERSAALARYAELMLPVLDSVRAARGQSSDAAGLASGVEMIHTQYLQSLSAVGAVVLDPLGEIFDPHQHEAIGERKTKKKDEHGRVLEVVRVGLKAGDRLVRAATVYIGKYADGD